MLRWLVEQRVEPSEVHLVSLRVAAVHTVRFAVRKMEEIFLFELGEI